MLKGRHLIMPITPLRVSSMIAVVDTHRISVLYLKTANNLFIVV